MLKRILHELKHHAPFTMIGALSGIVIMIFSYHMPHKAAYKVFYVLHPLHILFSAIVIASMYKIYHKQEGARKINLFALILIGYVGSVVLATLSDSIIPYWAEALLGLPSREMHIGCVEEWALVNPAAFIGMAIAFFLPRTKFPHSIHVLISTWASLFHIIMAHNGGLGLFSYLMIFIFLFIAVWIPCCCADIVFPLLFVKNPPPGCSCHHK